MTGLKTCLVFGDFDRFIKVKVMFIGYLVNYRMDFSKFSRILLRQANSW